MTDRHHLLGRSRVQRAELEPSSSRAHQHQSSCDKPGPHAGLLVLVRVPWSYRRRQKRILHRTSPSTPPHPGVNHFRGGYTEFKEAYKG